MLETKHISEKVFGSVLMQFMALDDTRGKELHMYGVYIE
jgi:hypothetical protein